MKKSPCYNESEVVCPSQGRDAHSAQLGLLLPKLVMNNVMVFTRFIRLLVGRQ